MFIQIACPNGRWRADKIETQPIVRQLRQEAGLRDAWPDPAWAYDALLVVAGRHGLGLETTDEAHERHAHYLSISMNPTQHHLRENTLRQAAIAYYSGTPPTMSDAEFDKTRAEHAEARQAQPHLDLWKDTMLDWVGAPNGFGDGFSKRRHLKPMQSLDNAQEQEDGTCPALEAWMSNLGIEHPWSRLVVEAKVDGLSISVVYVDGVLSRAVTRGDGTVGDDVTDNVVASAMVPLSLDFGFGNSIPSYFEVRGDGVMFVDTFERLNAARVAAGEEPWANPRNAAAGSLSLKDPQECAKRELRFIAHGVLTYGRFGVSPGEALSKLKHISRGEFLTVYGLVCDEDPQVTVRKIREASLPYQIDGAVLKVNDYDLIDEFGSTSRAPRWAIAYKFQQERARTTLKAITVQVGRTGALTPVAELEPVWIDGSKVSRATLHNEDQIQRLMVAVGDVVEVRKAAAIIPEVVSSITHQDVAERINTETEGVAADFEDKLRKARPPFSLLAHIGGRCPSCGGTDISKTTETAGEIPGEIRVAYRCNNKVCPAQLAARIKHAFARPALNVDGMGEEACTALAKALHAASPRESSPYAFVLAACGAYVGKADELANLTWTTETGGRMTFGETRGAKAAAALEAAQRLPLNRWLIAFGIPNIGVNTSKELTRLFKYVGELLLACRDTGIIKLIADGVPKDDERIAKYAPSDRLGVESCKALVEFCADPSGDDLLTYVYRAGVVSDNYAPFPQERTGPFSGKTVVITGTLSRPRPQIQSILEANGAKVSGSVSAKTDILVAGADCGSKLDKATKLGVRIMTEDEMTQVLTDAGCGHPND